MEVPLPLLVLWCMVNSGSVAGALTSGGLTIALEQSLHAPSVTTSGSMTATGGLETGDVTSAGVTSSGVI